MTTDRRLPLKVSLGLAAGLTSVAIIYILNRSGLYIAWAPIIAAALIGTVAGIAETSGRKIALGVILGCAGWVCGELFSRLLFHSIATWVFVGGFIGLRVIVLLPSRIARTDSDDIIIGLSFMFISLIVFPPVFV